MDMSVVTYMCISHFKANNHKKKHQKLHFVVVAILWPVSLKPIDFKDVLETATSKTAF